MDGYSNLHTIVMVDSYDRPTAAFPDTAVFTFPLPRRIRRCARIDLVQASVPNILYNIDNTKNQIIVIHEEYGHKMLLDVRVSPGHYDVFTFVDEVSRLLNVRLRQRYHELGITSVNLYRTLSGTLIRAVEVKGNGNIVTEDGVEYEAEEVVRIATFGQYVLQFLRIKGRMRMYFTFPEAVFTLVFAHPISNAEKDEYEALGITPSMLSNTSHEIMGIDPSRNYSTQGTTFAGYDPSVIGLTTEDIDTYDTANQNMVMSTRYMMIFYEPFVYLHILELVMPLDSIPTFWNDPDGQLSPGFLFKTLHTEDPTHSSYGKVLFPPFAKIVLTTYPGQVEFYNESMYENSKSMVDFPGGTFVDLERVTCVWTKKDGTILDFNEIDMSMILRFTENQMPFDE